LTAREREARSAMAAGRRPEAAVALTAAADAQRELNEKYPKSRYASAAHLDELAAKRAAAADAGAKK